MTDRPILRNSHIQRHGVPDGWLRAIDVADEHGIDPQAVRRWIRQGWIKLPLVGAGNTLLITPEEATRLVYVHMVWSDMMSTRRALDAGTIWDTPASVEATP